MKATTRLPFTKVNEWRSRWVHALKGSRIHRVAVVADRRAWKKFPMGDGQTVCGLVGKVWMPGFVSRLAAKRCPKCCKLLGIPTGIGAPYNDPTLFPPEGRALVSTPDQPPEK